jgi:hypothetical protein
VVLTGRLRDLYPITFLSSSPFPEVLVMSNPSTNPDYMACTVRRSIRPAAVALIAWTLLAAALLMLPTSLRGRDAADAALLARFKDEAPKQWEAYSGFSNHLIGKANTVRLLDGKPYRELQFDLKGTDDSHACEVTSIEADSKQEGGFVLSYNQKYAFSLISGKNGWALTKLDPKADNEIKSELADELGNLIQVGVRAAENPLHFLVRQPNFRIRDVHLQKSDRSEFAVVDFENPHPDREMPFCSIQSGSMVLDMKNQWVVVSGKFECQFSNAKAVVETETKYREGSEGLIPVRFVMTSQQTRPDRSLVMVSTTDYQLREIDKETGSAPPINLTSYGLPEPPLRQARLPHFYYIAGGAIALMLLSIVFKYASKRFGATYWFKR